VSSLRIERAANGYVVTARDPKIEKANQSENHKGPWRDPEREFIFDTLDKTLAWVKANIDKALPDDDYSSAFDDAAMEDEDD
jgi:hypothetical protein